MLYKMSKEHKKNYLKGLRSGEYSQIRGEYSDGTFSDMPCVCAVGLYLCQINGAEKVDIACDRGDTGSLDFGWMLREEDEDNSLIDDIVHFNDEEEHTFEQIADWVEENVEGV